MDSRLRKLERRSHNDPEAKRLLERERCRQGQCCACSDAPNILSLWTNSIPPLKMFITTKTYSHDVVNEQHELSFNLTCLVKNQEDAAKISDWIYSLATEHES